ncbi:MAG: hypothetical protein ACKVU2_05400, partial [Saprospiraceae bacterium]
MLKFATALFASTLFFVSLSPHYLISPLNIFLHENLLFQNQGGYRRLRRRMPGILMGSSILFTT